MSSMAYADVRSRKYYALPKVYDSNFPAAPQVRFKVDLFFCSLHFRLGNNIARCVSDCKCVHLNPI